jgi:hypothetical protein
MRKLAVLVVLFASTVAAEPRRIPFWPDEVPAAIQRHSDGAYAMAAVRALGRYHRVHGSPGYRQAADWVVGELKAGGLADAAIESLPADGKTSYAHFRSYLGWTATAGELEVVRPARRVLADYAKDPIGLADYSQDGDVTADLVDVSAGDRAASYQGKDVRGKLVLADGPLPAVHKLAVEERGALGIVSDFPNQRTGWSGLDPDLVRWGHLSPYETTNRFAFMISRRVADGLRQNLARGKVVLRARVRARMVAASYDIVAATIAGRDPAAGELVLTAHLCHERAGANDNASGSAALLAVARGLQAAITDGTLAPPRRTIRFLWLPEIAGSQAWLIRHPELAAKLRAGIHLDMVGGRPEVTHAALHVSRTPESQPHVANEIARAWIADVARASTAFAEKGEGDGMLAKGGGRDALVADLRPLELGSDHQVFEAFGVPMIYFHDWPDVTIHTSKDLPDNLDATKLGRVAYMTAGIAWTLAALPDAEAQRLPALERAATDERIAAARRRGIAQDLGAEDRQLGEREAAATGVEELASIAALWPSTAAEVKARTAGLAAPARRATGDGRVPERLPAVRGPLAVYYFDYLAGALGEVAPTALEKRDEVLAFEALNLVNGKRTIAEIRAILAGRYAPVPLAEVAEWIERLAKAGVVQLRK